MSEEWITRNDNPRKRDRRSYDSNWGVYEARASSGGFRSSFGSTIGGNNNTSGANNVNVNNSRAYSRGLNADSIVVEGERVGVLHNGSGGYQRQRQNNNYQPQHRQNSYQPPQRQPQQQQPSRIRVADHRGTAARVGNLPAQMNPYLQTNSNSSFPTNSNSSRVAASLPPALLASLQSNATPPVPIVTLPPCHANTLNTQQRTIIESILSGHSVFFTGPAGSGKSHILNTLLKANDELTKKKIVVTATTGVAACAIGGTTIHSFSGIAPNTSNAECLKRIMGNEYTKQRWREADILVIDEISMMGSGFLDRLEFVSGRVRNDRRVFGGLQLVVCGDFFQLPPIDLAKEGFAFQAKCWPRIFTHSVLLTQVFRQQSDTALMNLLDEARIGELSASSVQLLKRHATLPSAAHGGNNKKDGIIPTLLECRNKNVDAANTREMSKLPGSTHTYHSKDRAVSESYRKQLQQSCQAPSQLDLKVGAQVLLLKNIDLDKGLANGSRGVVVRFQQAKDKGEVAAGFKGMDLPVVRFDNVRGLKEEEDREFTILPEEWQNKMGDQTVSSRVQIPLRLAWSISVHKSQGMTIPNLTVNLSGVFEYGQAYVALSRATELRLLTLRGFSEKAFRAHPLVKEFYRMLENPSAAAAALATASNKENVDAHHGNELGELPDPFGGASNPYQQQKPRVRNFPPSNKTQGGPTNPFQKRPYVQKNAPASSPYSRGNSLNLYQQQPFNNAQNQMPRQAQPHRSTSYSGNTAKSPPPTNITPTLTEDQKRRMEENRQRALAIRRKREMSLS